jgi:hypothetical protein
VCVTDVLATAALLAGPERIVVFGGVVSALVIVKVATAGVKSSQRPLTAWM